MKILHVTHSLVGGPAAYLDEIADAQLAALGKGNVKFLLPFDQVQYCQRLPTDAVLTFTATSRSALSLFNFSRELLQSIRNEKPTILHLHSTFAGAIGRLCLPFFPAPRPRVIYCPHGWSFGMKTTLWKRLLYASLELALAPAADRIVMISEHDQRQGKRWGQQAARLHLIRNAVRDHLPLQAHTPPPFDSQKLNLLFVGRLDRQKGLDTLLNAFAQARRDDTQLHVIGESFLTREHHPLPLPEGVTLHGWKSRDELIQFYTHADALVVPSRWEGFGLVAAEALRSGCPVLAARVGGLPELVVPDKTGFLFPPDSVTSLAQLLTTIQKRDLLRLRPQARQHYQQYFDATRMNDQLLSLYASIAPDANAAVGSRRHIEHV